MSCWHVLHQTLWGEWRTEDIAFPQIFIRRLKLAKLPLTPFQNARTTICHRELVFPSLVSSIKHFLTCKLNLMISGTIQANIRTSNKPKHTREKLISSAVALNQHLVWQSYHWGYLLLVVVFCPGCHDRWLHWQTCSMISGSCNNWEGRGSSSSLYRPKRSNNVVLEKQVGEKTKSWVNRRLKHIYSTELKIHNSLANVFDFFNMWPPNSTPIHPRVEIKYESKKCHPKNDLHLVRKLYCNPTNNISV